uniref:Protein CASC3 n=1 Tax=Onchocerca volvulus TaxID=6282 RepID=A0A8R1TN41_ONCVO
MSAVSEVEVKTPEASCTPIITTTAASIIPTTTATTDSTTDNATTTTTTTTTDTTAIDIKEQMKDTVENPTPSCTKLDDPENGQLHSDFSANSATVPTTEKPSSAITEEKAQLVQSSNSDTVAKDDVITNNANVNRPEVTAATSTFETEDSVSNSEQNKADFNMSNSNENNLKINSDQISKPEVVPASSNPAPSENQINSAISTVVETSDASFMPSDGEKKEKDLKDEGIGGIRTEKDSNGSEGNYKIKKKSVSVDDKEASSDETDHFVDAKSSTHIDDGSGDDTIEISGEAKEQTEEIQDEEGYEYDEEEQEAEPDDDEVEGNPAFIPKSGPYYMHDSRNIDEERTLEPSSHSRADGKWKHDRFDERSQRPKTKRELLNRYGYDIRNEGKNTGSGNMNTSTQHSSQTRGTSRGASNYGNRGRHSNRALPHHPQHQPDDRYDHRKLMQNNGVRRPPSRGGRRGEHHFSVNHQRNQRGTRVFKNSPTNIQKDAINRTDNYRSSDRNEEYLRDNGQNGSRGRGSSGSDPSTAHAKSGGGHTGGKRYSTQRLATHYTSNVQQPPPPQPQPPPLQPTPTTGPIPIPPPDWRPPAYQGPPPPSNVPPPPPPPPPIAIPAPVPNFRPSDIVYFDPQPQQLYRNPIPPRTKKRLEIVPPYQAKNSN